MNRRRLLLIGAVPVAAAGVLWLWPMAVRTAALPLFVDEWGGPADVDAVSWAFGRTVVLTAVRSRGGATHVSVHRIELTFAANPVAGDPGPLLSGRFFGCKLEHSGEPLATIDEVRYTRTEQSGKQVLISGLDGTLRTDRVDAWVATVSRIVEAPGIAGDGQGQVLDAIGIVDSRLDIVVPTLGDTLRVPVEQLAGRLRLTTAKSLVVEELSARFCAGELRGNGEVDWRASPQEWHAQVNLEGLSVASAARLTDALPASSSGTLTAFVDLRAAAEDVIGAGWVEAERLAVWEQAVAARVLGELGVETRREDSVDARATLRIDRGRIYFTHLIALGDPVNLFGNGSVRLDGTDLSVGLVPRFLERRRLEEIPLTDGGAGDLLLDVLKGTLIEMRMTGGREKIDVFVQPVPLVTEPLRGFLDLLR